MGLRAIAVLALIAGCYDVPTPVCGFSCLQENECPDGYTCMSNIDGFCHLNGYEDATCPGHSGSNFDTTSPFVSAVSPDPSTPLQASTPIVVRFSEQVVGVTSESFFAMSNATGEQLFSGVQRLDAVNWEISPTFLPDDSFSIILTDKITDIAGNRLVPTSFTYSSVTTKPPMFVTSTPQDGEQNVSVGTTAVRLFFDKPAVNIVSKFHFTDEQGTPVQNLVDQTSDTQSPLFKLRYQLAANMQYFATIDAGLMDLNGNTTTQGYFFSFKTGVDDVGPRVYSRSPGVATSGIPVNSGITLDFDEDALNVVDGSIVLMKGGVVVPTTLTSSALTKSASLRPDNQLTGLTQYDVFVSSAITDTLGNACLDGGWSFQTASDHAPPGIRSTVPKTGTSTALGTTTITITFNEPILDLDDTTFFVGENGVGVTGTLVATDGNRIWTFTPDMPFSAGSEIGVDVFVSDQFGNSTSYSFSFSIAP